MKETNCKSCGASIIWMVMESTKRPHPFNAKPVTGWHETGLTFGDARVVTSGRYYVSHFATCPNAKEHRKENSP